MSVVARLSCISVERNQWFQTYKLQPVVAGASKDPHSAEIAQFFAATPSGNVTISDPLDADVRMTPGDHVYLFLAPAPKDASDTERLPVVEVKSVRLDGWATGVALAARNDKGPNWEPWKLEFTIRNERAAEQFNPGSRFYVSLEPVQEAPLIA